MCLENNNYLVQMRQTKRLTRLHANSLRKFHADVPSEKTVSAVVYEYCDDDDERKSLNCSVTGGSVTADAEDKQQVSDQLTCEAGVNDGRAQTDNESDKVGDTHDPTDVKSAIGQQLTDEQAKQMHALLTEYLDVFDPNPGLTDFGDSSYSTRGRNAVLASFVSHSGKYEG